MLVIKEEVGVELDWINIIGLIILVLMLLPNMIYASRSKEMVNQCHNKGMNFMEQIGRYGSMFLMCFNIGILEFGFRTKEDYTLWIISSSVLLLLYFIFWGLYFERAKKSYAIALAVIPSIIFIFNGYIRQHYLLLIIGVIFSIGHIYVTYQNNRN
ncbi:MAG: hypothetical protein K0S76_1557 [Herbinix sp.]|jgi:hypothetical protein|nr:hypothetical protein [Herbinix sp.]